MLPNLVFELMVRTMVALVLVASVVWAMMSLGRPVREVSEQEAETG